MLTTRNQDARQNGMSSRTWFGAIATVGLACDHGGAQHPLGQVIRSVQLLDVKKAQQMRAMFAQAFGEAGIVEIAESAVRRDQGVKTRLQVLGVLEESKWVQVGFLPFQSQSLLQDGRHLAGKLQRSPTLALLHLFQILEQVAQTFLLQPGAQSLIIVGKETVRSQNSLELLTQDVDHDITAAVGADRVYGGFAIREDPQLGGQCANSPTGLIGVDDTALPDHFKQLCINGAGSVGKFLVGLTPATTAHLQPKGILQNFTHFAV